MTSQDVPRRPRPGLPPHRRRRRRLLAWSAPLVLAFLVAGSLLLGTALGNVLGTREYDASRFPEAARQYAAQQRWTGFAEQWKAWFNSGTARYRAEEHFLAVEDLRVALDRVPEAGPLPGGPEGSKAPESPECRVRTNLSLAVEAMGDVAATGDPGGGMAESHYAEAQQIIAPCTTSQQNEETSERQQDKEDQAREDSEQPEEEPTDPPPGDEQGEDSPSDEPTDDPGEGEEPTDEPSEEPTDGPGEGQTEEPTQDPQREELEERNREAERDRQEQQERGGGGQGTGQNW